MGYEVSFSLFTWYELKKMPFQNEAIKNSEMISAELSGKAGV